MQPFRFWSRVGALCLALVLASVAVASAHDLFLKPARFFVPENSDVLVRVLNGTFSKSENVVARARLNDVSLVSPSGRERLDTTVWTTAGDTSSVTIRVGTAGTYLVAASTKPNVIALKAKDFNTYLASDGVPDVLESRRRGGELERPVRERYSKHVKTLIQAGSTRSEQIATELGYPAEILPLNNPYALRVGGTVRIRTLVDGQPVPNQYILYGGRTPDGGRLAQRSIRSNDDGVALVPVRSRGTWYVKFIHMTRVDGDSVDYESKWATLTYQVR
jgi:uncharacterized GH25 family protein